MPHSQDAIPFPYPTQPIGLATATQVRQLARWGKGGIGQLLYSPDGQRLAVVTGIGIYLYTIPSFQEDQVLPDDLWVSVGMFAPDSRSFALGTAQGSVYLWNLLQNTLRQIRPPQKGRPITQLAFSGDGQRLAAGSEWQGIQIWNVADGQPFPALETPRHSLLSLALDSSGDELIAAYSTARLHRFAVHTGQLAHTIEVLVPRWQHGALTADGQVGAGLGRSLDIYRPADGTVLYTLPWSSDRGGRITLTPDGRLVASGDQTGVVRLWHLPGETAPRTFDTQSGWAWRVAIAPDGHTLAASGIDQVVHIWRIADGTQQAQLTGFTDSVESLAFAPNGHILATGAFNGQVHLWQNPLGTALHTLTDCRDGINSVAFRPDGQMLAASSDEDPLYLWHVPDGPAIPPLRTGTNYIRSLAFTPSGDTLALGAIDGIQLWDWATQTLRQGWAEDDIKTIAVSPDGHLLAWGTETKRVRLWSLLHTQRPQLLRGHTDEVWTVAFSPDGQLLASGGKDDTVRIWRVSDGTRLHTLRHQRSWVMRLTFAPDGQTLAVAHGDGTIVFWRMPDGALLGQVRGHNNRLLTLAFSPDGHLLASGGDDGTVRLWGYQAGDPVSAPVPAAPVRHRRSPARRLPTAQPAPPATAPYYVFRPTVVMWRKQEVAADLETHTPGAPDATAVWWQGQPLATAKPLITYSLLKNAPILDVYRSAYYELYSQRLIALLHAAGVRYETFPVRLVDRRTQRMLAREYALFHLLETHSAIDPAASDQRFEERIKQANEDPTDSMVRTMLGPFFRIPTLVLTAVCLQARRPMLRIAEYPYLTIVHHDLKQVLDQAGIVGCEYIPVGLESTP